MKSKDINENILFQVTIDLLKLILFWNKIAFNNFENIPPSFIQELYNHYKYNFLIEKKKNIHIKKKWGTSLNLKSFLILWIL